MSVATTTGSCTTHARKTGPGVHVYYGGGLIEYEYKPLKGKVERLCGVLGKDKRVSQNARNVTYGHPPDSAVCRGLWIAMTDQSGHYRIGQDRYPGSCGY
jgi:hypothetical protein